MGGSHNNGVIKFDSILSREFRFLNQKRE